MKNKTPLVLMEQLMMILVFALAAALCLQAFIKADQISRETEQRTQAAALAQTAAETLKACGGDFGKAAHILGGEITTGEWQICFDQNGVPLTESDSYAFLLEVTEVTSPAADLRCAEVCVSAGDGGSLVTLQVVWRAA